MPGNKKIKYIRLTICIHQYIFSEETEQKKEEKEAIIIHFSKIPEKNISAVLNKIFYFISKKRDAFF